MILFWHRRDIRITDNAGLYRALTSGQKVQPVFIFDQTILNKLPKKDLRVQFIYQEILELNEEYSKFGCNLVVYYGNPVSILKDLLTSSNLYRGIYTNRDYEPQAIERDKEVYSYANSLGKEFKAFKDQVIFDRNEVIKDNDKPYTVFTPYSRKWKAKFNEFYFKPYPTEKYLENLNQTDKENSLPTLESMGFESSDFLYSPKSVSTQLIKKYKDRRDIPSLKGTSRLSLHLRFGTVSIRSLAKMALENSETWLNELIWRDFYQTILYHFPETVDQPFKKQYSMVEWEKSPKNFDLWCMGQTGYPIVDAGMRELNETGFMHNRVRMIVASFLTKHLLLDWKLGERYFAEKLLDFELASNIGGWQWAASCGCDAVPYFRIFNPHLQLKKFDPELKYVKKWVPEYGTENYTEEIIEHKFARERALDRFKKALN